MNTTENPLDDLVAQAENELNPAAGGCGSVKPIWDRQALEPGYAVLKDLMHQDTNQYGQKIDLLELTEGKLPEGRSMYINDNPAVGTNPNRNKQHGFYFNADNCIGCHACEAACSEKNENPAHIAYRSVGYVEGGSFPDFQRMNISMACNHCDDPVCLKGCPTKAYTKHAEYGAVLQDPDTCFGCGYCTWVCPYNAPQLDPVKGQVSKCNMCVDRLEVGLKPSCVSACVGNALDFGVVENIPENRQQAEVSIPGFPDPKITQPNIRFQQTKKLPDEMHRTDSMPVKYRQNESGDYEPAVDRKLGKAKFWNLARLSSRENPLVVFTLLTQMGIGAFTIAFIASLFSPSFAAFKASSMYVPMIAMTCACIAIGLFMSTVHLGKPLKFYRGFNNLRWSPVSREGLGVAMFMTFAGLHLLFSLPSNAWLQSVVGIDLSALAAHSVFNFIGQSFAVLAIVSGAIGLYYMVKCYLIPARPFWNHWQTATSFIGNAIALGALLLSVLATATLAIGDYGISTVVTVGGSIILLGLLAESCGLIAHAKAMRDGAHEGAASFYIQDTTFGKTYLLRNALLGLNVLLVIGLLISQSTSLLVMCLWGLSAFILVTTSIISRALFYILVVPTTMPGAFFWKNKGFEEHAKDIGLAASMPSAGIIDSAH
ncbi:MAG: dimethyl sulfoxide reductase anchor subunit [Acidiferrobacterales bacterium]|nr:dimethyl sulfoxide reductase anchor subunit [Acidiferrobacterales bacterium]